MWVQKRFSELGISEDNDKMTLAAWLNRLEERYYIDEKIILQSGNSNTSIVAVKLVNLTVDELPKSVFQARKDRIAEIFEEN
jgi:hypothetical protein